MGIQAATLKNLLLNWDCIIAVRPLDQTLPISKSSYINTNLSGKPEIFIYMSAESYGTKNAISLSFSTFSQIKNDEYRQKQPILPEIQKNSPWNTFQYKYKFISIIWLIINTIIKIIINKSVFYHYKIIYTTNLLHFNLLFQLSLHNLLSATYKKQNVVLS